MRIADAMFLEGVGYPQNFGKFEFWIFAYSATYIFSTYSKRNRTKFQKVKKLQSKMCEPAHDSGCRAVPHLQRKKDELKSEEKERP